MGLNYLRCVSDLRIRVEAQRDAELALDALGYDEWWDLPVCFAKQGWLALRDGRGDIVGLIWDTNHPGTKYSHVDECVEDIKPMFEALAPWIAPGSYVQWYREAENGVEAFAEEQIWNFDGSHLVCSVPTDADDARPGLDALGSCDVEALLALNGTTIHLVRTSREAIVVDVDASDGVRVRVFELTQSIPQLVDENEPDGPYRSASLIARSLLEAWGRSPDSSQVLEGEHLDPDVEASGIDVDVDIDADGLVTLTSADKTRYVWSHADAQWTCVEGEDHVWSCSRWWWARRERVRKSNEHDRAQRQAAEYRRTAPTPSAHADSALRTYLRWLASSELALGGDGERSPAAELGALLWRGPDEDLSSLFRELADHRRVQETFLELARVEVSGIGINPNDVNASRSARQIATFFAHAAERGQALYLRRVINVLTEHAMFDGSAASYANVRSLYDQTVHEICTILLGAASAALADAQKHRQP